MFEAEGLTGSAVMLDGSFSSDERAKLKTAVSELGGHYLPDLVWGRTTHLVCKTLLDAFGMPKYMKAIEWGLPIVNARWIVDSLAAKALLPVEQYKTDVLYSSEDILGLGQRAPLSAIENRDLPYASYHPNGPAWTGMHTSNITPAPAVHATRAEAVQPSHHPCTAAAQTYGQLGYGAAQATFQPGPPAVSINWHGQGFGVGSTSAHDSQGFGSSISQPPDFNFGNPFSFNPIHQPAPRSDAHEALGSEHHSLSFFPQPPETSGMPSTDHSSPCLFPQPPKILGKTSPDTPRLIPDPGKPQARDLDQSLGQVSRGISMSPFPSEYDISHDPCMAPSTTPEVALDKRPGPHRASMGGLGSGSSSPTYSLASSLGPSVSAMRDRAEPRREGVLQEGRSAAWGGHGDRQYMYDDDEELEDMVIPGEPDECKGHGGGQNMYDDDEELEDMIIPVESDECEEHGGGQDMYDEEEVLEDMIIPGESDEWEGHGGGKDLYDDDEEMGDMVIPGEPNVE
eukprot:gene12693-15925_t